MATKEEYQEALNRMEEAYYNFDSRISSINKFKEDINLLTGLVNEHFEEKQETNYEHYKDEIIEDSGFILALVGGKPCKCSSVSCSDCGFSTGHGCSEKIKEWLTSPYKKLPYKLSQFEFDIIQTYRDCHESCKISEFKQLIELKDKGYFKCIDHDTKIQDVLKNCEVIQ